MGGSRRAPTILIDEWDRPMALIGHNDLVVQPDAIVAFRQAGPRLPNHCSEITQHGPLVFNIAEQTPFTTDFQVGEIVF